MNERVYSISYLRATACLAVVLLHISASETILYKETLTTIQLFAATCVYNLMMWAVPCFIMVSGALLLDPKRDITLKKIYTAYIPRVLIPLLICSFLFRFFDMIMNREAFSPKVMLSALHAFFTGSGWSHLWYVYLLIGIYLLLPFYRKLTRYCSNTEIRYYLLIHLIFLSLLPLTKVFGSTCGFYIHTGTIYPMYFILGSALHTGIVKVSRHKAIIMVLAGTLGIVLFTFLNVYGYMGQSNLTGYSSPLVVLQAAGIFSMFDHMTVGPGSRLTHMVESVDRNSFDIYLLHMLFVRLVLRYMGVDLFDYTPIISYIVMQIATFTISYFCAVIIGISKRYL